jgi:putative ATP-dependent endonuclease of OLD family
LETLALGITEKNCGLGTYNKLYIAAELLHLQKKDHDGLKLGLIEEVEAHLHPQAQLRVIEHLQNHSHIQFILTTHSPNLASKVKLKNLILCAQNFENKPTVFPLGPTYTKLGDDDYIFLQKFLDVTKTNLLFSKGVILVEGWAEEILIPSLAKKIGFDLTKYGVSVINVASTAFLRYSKIFLSQQESNYIKTPVSIVTDVDARTYVKNGDDYELIPPETVGTDFTQKYDALTQEYNSQSVQSFISPHWTLEYSLFKSTSIGTIFQQIVKEVHSGTDWDTDFQKTLAKKLIEKTLKKTEIAYLLAKKIDDDMTFENAEINVDVNNEEDAIHYLIKAIRYACEGLPNEPETEDEI